MKPINRTRHPIPRCEANLRSNGKQQNQVFVRASGFRGFRARLSKLNAKKGLLAVSFTLVTIILGAFIWAVAATTNKDSVIAPRPTTASQPSFAQQVLPAGAGLVNRAALDSHAVRALDSLGDRFERSGKERLTQIALLKRHIGAGVETSNIQVIRELSNALRIDEQTSSGVRVRGFDGRSAWANNGSLTDDDKSLIELLVRDTPEYFIRSQAAAFATRILGDRFRVGDDTSTSSPVRLYDILFVVDTFTSSGKTDFRPTFFYLNSQSGLPEKIAYGDESERAEIEFSSWVEVSGQTIPQRIVMTRGGVIAYEIEVTQAVFGPAFADGFANGPTR